MNLIALIAEQRIQAALEAGEFENLPGHGKPLAEEDFSGVPEHLRVGYKILKNAGVLPVEMELRKEMADLRDRIAVCGNVEEEQPLRKKLQEASMKYHLLLEQHLRGTQKP